MKRPWEAKILNEERLSYRQLVRLANTPTSADLEAGEAVNAAALNALIEQPRSIMRKRP